MRFYYTGDGARGLCLVEPHMVAYTQQNNLVLSAWFLGGADESQEKPGWRDYLVSEMTQITVFPEHFAGPRPGYDPYAGEKFHSVKCAL